MTATGHDASGEQERVADGGDSDQRRDDPTVLV
jgi:hypothetical protein